MILFPVHTWDGCSAPNHGSARHLAVFRSAAGTPMRPALVSVNLKCVTLGFKGDYVVADEMAQMVQKIPGVCCALTGLEPAHTYNRYLGL